MKKQILQPALGLITTLALVACDFVGGDAASPSPTASKEEQGAGANTMAYGLSSGTWSFVEGPSIDVAAAKNYYRLHSFGGGVQMLRPGTSDWIELPGTRGAKRIVAQVNSDPSGEDWLAVINGDGKVYIYQGGVWKALANRDDIDQVREFVDVAISVQGQVWAISHDGYMFRFGHTTYPGWPWNDTRVTLHDAHAQVKAMTLVGTYGPTAVVYTPYVVDRYDRLSHQVWDPYFKKWIWQQQNASGVRDICGAAPRGLFNLEGNIWINGAGGTLNYNGDYPRDWTAWGASNVSRLGCSAESSKLIVVNFDQTTYIKN